MVTFVSGKCRLLGTSRDVSYEFQSQSGHFYFKSELKKTGTNITIKHSFLTIATDMRPTVPSSDY